MIIWLVGWVPLIFFLVGFFRIKLIHGLLQAGSGEREHHFHGGVDGGLDGVFHFLPFKSPENVFDLIALREIVSHAETKAGEIGMPQCFDDVAESVVGAAAAFGAHAEGSRRKVDVIANHEDVFRRDVLVLHPVADCFAAEIHISRGKRQYEGAAFVPAFGNVGVAVGAKSDPQFFGDGINHFKTNVVPCAGIFVLRVAQTENDEFPAVFHFLFFKLQNYETIKNK